MLFVWGFGADIAGIDKLTGLVIDFEEVIACPYVVLALLLLALLLPYVAQHEKAVIDNVLKQHEFLLLLNCALGMFLQHVVASNELSNNFLTLTSTGLQIFYEVNLRHMISSEGSNAALAFLVG